MVSSSVPVAIVFMPASVAPMISPPAPIVAPGQSSLQPGVVPFAQASTPLIAWPATPVSVTTARSRTFASSRPGRAHSAILRAIGEEGERAPGLARPRARWLPDALLEELTSDPALAFPSGSDRPVPAGATTIVAPTEVSAGPETASPTDPARSAVPDGPMARRESPDRSSGLADLLLAAGLCGLGAGLKTGRRGARGRRTSESNFPSDPDLRPKIRSGSGK